LGRKISRKKKGTNFENYVKRKLEFLGYKVFRCAASKPIDLIALAPGEVVLVECKDYENPPRSGFSTLLELAEELDVKALAVYKRKNRVVMEWLREPEN